MKQLKSRMFSSGGVSFLLATTNDSGNNVLLSLMIRTNVANADDCVIFFKLLSLSILQRFQGVFKPKRGRAAFSKVEFQVILGEGRGSPWTGPVHIHTCSESQFIHFEENLENTNGRENM